MWWIYVLVFVICFTVGAGTGWLWTTFRVKANLKDSFWGDILDVAFPWLGAMVPAGLFMLTGITSGWAAFLGLAAFGSLLLPPVYRRWCKDEYRATRGHLGVLSSQLRTENDREKR